MTTREHTTPRIVYEEGRPVAVILDIDSYEDILERLEEIDDLAALREVRSRPQEFRPLNEFLAEHEG